MVVHAATVSKTDPRFLHETETPMKSNHNALTALSIASALVVGVATFAAPGYATAADEDAMKSDQPVTDTWITTKVKTELATTDGVKSMDIDVKTVDGVVMLTGVQPNDIAVKKAIAAARSIKGVKDVDSSGLKSQS